MLSNSAATITRTSLHARLWKRWAITPYRVARLPVMIAALCFAAGATVAAYNWIPVSLLIVIAIALVALTVIANRCAPRVVLLPAFALWVAAGHLCLQLEPLPSSQTELAMFADNLSREVHGTVTRIQPVAAQRQSADVDPETVDYDDTKQPGATVDLDLKDVEEVMPDASRMRAVHGGVRIYLLSEMPVLQCGDSVRVALQLREAERYRDPGVWQYADYLQQQGIGATARVDASKLHVTSGNATLPCRIHAAATWATLRLNHFIARASGQRHMPALTSEDGAMLNAMLFGDRSSLTQNLRTSFERTGTFHIFVVAGMHLAMLAAIVYGLLKMMRIPEGWRVLATLTLASAYALLTGFAPPVQRALGMTAVFLITRWLSRDRNVLNALGSAALAVMIAAPHLLFEASLQMTVLVIFAIGGIAVPIVDRTFGPYLRAAQQLTFIALDTGFPPRLAQFRVLLRMFSLRAGWLFGRRARPFPSLLVRVSLRCLELTLISLIAELVMALPMAIYFHRLTLLSVPVNLLAIPLLGVLMPCAIATFCAALLWMPLATMPAAITATLLHAISALTRHASSFEVSDIRMPAPPGLAVAIVLLLWSATVWLLRRPGRVALLSIPAMAIAATLIVWPYSPAKHAEHLEVTAVDVGQGDSLLIESPSGQTMLVDSGGPVGSPQAVADNRWDIGEDVVSPYLWSRHVRRLDVVVLTHAHSDHMGGMAAVLHNFHPKELWLSVDADTASFRALVHQAKQQGTAIRHMRAGDMTTWSGTTIRTLAPAANYPSNLAPTNNDSLVLQIDYGKSSVLLEGDAEEQSERAMLAGNLLRTVTLLKIGHHGSRTSTTSEFLAVAHPQFAVISVGRNNHFGHPRGEVLQRLQEARVSTRRTDMNGVSTYLLDIEGRVTQP